MIGNCGNNKKINYSCCAQVETVKAYSEYGSTTAFLQFDGKTLYETEDVVLEICGTFTNLGITWNESQSILEGTYTGETIFNSGLVKNNCNYLDIDKFHGDCINTIGYQINECETSHPKLGVSSAAGIVTGLLKKA